MSSARSRDDHDPALTSFARGLMADRSRGWKLSGCPGNVAALAIMLLVLVPGLPAQSSSSAGHATALPGQVLIVVGLAGDPEHEKLFRETATTWRDWLTGPLKFPRDSVRILCGARDRCGAGARAGDLRKRPPRRGRDSWKAGSGGTALGVLSGPCEFREGHVYFHLPGPDLGDDECGGIFRGIPCREQVFWITTAASGAFSARPSPPRAGS